MQEWSTLKVLPDHGEKCLCFGHKTYCCKEDMEKDAAWHEVIFKFKISLYKLKDKFPDDVEESILEAYKIYEKWQIDDESFVIGVTKWKNF